MTIKNMIIYIFIINIILCNIEKEKERKINFIKYYFSYFSFYFSDFSLTFYYNKYRIQICNINIIAPNIKNINFISEDNINEVLIDETTFTFIARLKIIGKNLKKEIIDNNAFFEIQKKDTKLIFQGESIDIKGGNIGLKIFKSVIDGLNFYKSFNLNGIANVVTFKIYGQPEYNRTMISTNRCLIEYFNNLINHRDGILNEKINLYLYDFYQNTFFLKTPFGDDNKMFKSLSLTKIVLYFNNLFTRDELQIDNLQGYALIMINDESQEIEFNGLEIKFKKTITKTSSKTNFDFSLKIGWDHFNLNSEILRNDTMIEEFLLYYLKNNYERYINRTIYDYFSNIFS